MRAWQVVERGEATEVLERLDLEALEPGAGPGAQLSGLIARGASRSAVTDAVSLDDIPGASQRVGDNAAVGKVVMVVDA